MGDKRKSIIVNEDVWAELKALKHPGQSFNGFFIEHFNLEVEA